MPEKVYFGSLFLRRSLKYLLPLVLSLLLMTPLLAEAYRTTCDKSLEATQGYAEEALRQLEEQILASQELSSFLLNLLNERTLLNLNLTKTGGPETSRRIYRFQNRKGWFFMKGTRMWRPLTAGALLLVMLAGCGNSSSSPESSASPSSTAASSAADSQSEPEGFPKMDKITIVWRHTPMSRITTQIILPRKSWKTTMSNWNLCCFQLTATTPRPNSP